MFEKRLAQLSPRLITVDGTADGTLQIDDAFLLKAKQTLLLKSSTQTTVKVQVKRVLSPTLFIVGPIDGVDDTILDVSNFTVADAAYVSNPDAHQLRPEISPEDFTRAVYDELPVKAIRTVLVDRGGQYIGSDPNSPFYVQLTDGSVNIGTVNAQLEVFLSHRDNDPDAGDVHASVRIGDGQDLLAVNPDGSINVVATSGASTGVAKNEYSEVSSVPTALSTLITSFTALPGRLTYLQRITVSGSNVASYKVKLNGVPLETLRTYFGGSLNAATDFLDGGRGFPIQPADVVTVEVIHTRPDVGDFNARIQVIEV